MKLNPVIRIERESWSADSILIRVNDGVYICTCSVKSYRCICMTKHIFMYDSNLKPLN